MFDEPRFAARLEDRFPALLRAAVRFDPRRMNPPQGTLTGNAPVALESLGWQAITCRNVLVIVLETLAYHGVDQETSVPDLRLQALQRGSTQPPFCLKSLHVGMCRV